MTGQNRVLRIYNELLGNNSVRNRQDLMAELGVGEKTLRNNIATARKSLESSLKQTILTLHSNDYSDIWYILADASKVEYPYINYGGRQFSQTHVPHIYKEA